MLQHFHLALPLLDNLSHQAETAFVNYFYVVDNYNFNFSFADEEEADGEELFGDNMEQDYRPMPGLDRYDPGTQFNRNISWLELNYVQGYVIKFCFVRCPSLIGKRAI